MYVCMYYSHIPSIVFQKCTLVSANELLLEVVIE